MTRLQDQPAKVADLPEEPYAAFGACVAWEIEPSALKHVYSDDARLAQAARVLFLQHFGTEASCAVLQGLGHDGRVIVERPIVHAPGEQTVFMSCSPISGFRLWSVDVAMMGCLVVLRNDESGCVELCYAFTPILSELLRLPGGTYEPPRLIDAEFEPTGPVPC